MRLLSALLLLVLCNPCRAAAQSCPTPQLPPASGEINLFTAEKADILGEIVAEQVMREFQLVNEPALNAHLQEVADQLAALSGAGKVHVELFDIPDVNAFTFPGARILVSRKLVAYAKNEDELAGVLAHEFGHVLTRDAEREISARMRKVLNITSVGDRRDIEDKYNRLIENERRKNFRTSRGESEQEQQIADHYAVWLMARAGYDPEAYTQLWDRWNELKSQTGSWLSDFFGTSKPGAKRLRLALKALSTMPPSCVGKRTVNDAQFKQWQRSVVEASRAQHTASLHNVVSERKLEPALRTDISHLRISPNGKWFLAQDDASIFVFSRDPLAFSFRVDASDARPAEFSPDSSSLVFYDTNYRVERWNVGSHKRESVHEVALNKPCMDTALSRDGMYLACATPDLELRVWDVASSNVVFEKKNFYTPTRFDVFTLLIALLQDPDAGMHFFRMAFSPDARYLVCARGDGYVAVDISRRQAISLPGSIRARIGMAFAFMGNDRIVGVNPQKWEDSGIVSFPTGEVITKMRLGNAQIQVPAHGSDHLILRPVVRFPVGVFDVKQNKALMANRTNGFDIYDDIYISERRNGEIGEYKFGQSTPIATVAVPIGPLGRIRAADLSPDFHLLALSQRSRGAVWDLQSGERKAFVRGFRGALVEQNGTAYLDFPPFEATSRMVVQMNTTANTYDPLLAFGKVKEDDKATGWHDESAKVTTRISDTGAAQCGAYLVGWREQEKNDQRELVVRDVRSGNELWSRKFGKSWPERTYAEERNQRLVLQWTLDDAAARRMVDASPTLKAEFQAMNAKKDAVGLLEVVDLAKGTTQGVVLVDFGGYSFRIHSVQAVGDSVIVGDNHNRTLVYSLSTGKQVGHAFGTPLRVSANGSLLFVENNPGQVSLYALPAMEKRDELTFASGVSFAHFSEDGKLLFVLTKDQTAYTVALGAADTGVAAAR